MDSFSTILNRTDKWKIVRPFTEHRIPAIFAFEDIASDLIIIVILIALLAILPGLQNKVIKDWIKIFIGFCIGAVLLCALTHNYWVSGRLDIPIHTNTLDQATVIDNNTTWNITKSITNNTNQSINETKTLSTIAEEKLNDIYVTFNIKIGLSTINVSIIARNGQILSIVHLNQLNEKYFGVNEQLSLVGLDACSFNYEQGLTFGWPHSLLNMAEYLSNGYFHFYFSGPEFTWCSNFRTAAYISERLIHLAIPVLLLTIVLYLKFMIYEAAIGTILLGTLMLASNLNYVFSISNISPLASFNYYIADLSTKYGTIDLGFSHRNDTQFTFNYSENLILETNVLRLHYGWNFWMVFATGCICVAAGVSLYTAYTFYPQYLSYAFDEVTLANISQDGYTNVYMSKESLKILNADLASSTPKRISDRISQPVEHLNGENPNKNIQVPLPSAVAINITNTEDKSGNSNMTNTNATSNIPQIYINDFPVATIRKSFLTDKNDKFVSEKNLYSVSINTPTDIKNSKPKNLKNSLSYTNISSMLRHPKTLKRSHTRDNINLSNIVTHKAH